MKIIAGTSNPPLAQAIANELGISLTKTKIQRFSDGETFVEVLENVRGEDVFVIQPTSAPANEHLVELLVAIDALKRGSAKQITAVIPYYGYARQDRKSGPRAPITAKLTANLITEAGADRILTMDLHSGQIQGFFDIPTDNLYVRPVFVRDMKQKYAHSLDNLCIVSPDAGGTVRARGVAQRIGNETSLAIIDKRRERANQSEVMHVVGDVEGKDCIIVDDICDTAGTLCHGAQALIDNGAKSVTAYITHGVLSGSALPRIMDSALEELVIADTIYSGEQVDECKKIRTVSVAPIMAEAMKRIVSCESVSSLFE